MVDPESVRERDPDPYSEQMITLMLTAAGLEWTVEDASPIETGANTVYRLRVRESDGPSRRVVFKAAGENDDRWFCQKPKLMKWVADHTQIPVPTVYGHHLEPTDLPAPSYVMAFVDGYSPSDDETTPVERPLGIDDAHRALFVQQVGEHLAQLHGSTTLPETGRLAVEDGTLFVADPDDSWYERIRRLVTNPDGPLEYVDEGADEVRTFVNRAVAELGNVSVVPAHNDYQPKNVVVDPDSGRVEGVLDWGEMRSVDPVYELATTEHYFSKWAPIESDRRRAVRKNLYEGYRRRRTLPDDGRFERRHHLYLLVGVLSSLSWAPYWPEPLAARFLDRQRRLLSSILDSGGTL